MTKCTGTKLDFRGATSKGGKEKGRKWRVEGMGEEKWERELRRKSMGMGGFATVCFPTMVGLS